MSERDPREVLRHQAVGEDESVDAVAKRELIQKHQRVQHDQPIVTYGVEREGMTSRRGIIT